jgi:hypothetical protein
MIVLKRRQLSTDIENLVISFYAKGLNNNDIERAASGMLRGRLFRKTKKEFAKV